MNRDELQAVFKAVQENAERLHKCPGPRHLFLIQMPAQPLRAKYECQVCKGTVDFHAHHWYVTGLQHATRKES